MRKISISFIALIFAAALSVSAQKNALKIDYTVKLDSIKQQQFHITTDIKNIRQDRLDLSLPTWAPGWYTVENYQKNMLRFKVTDAGGKALPLTMSRKQTWNVNTKGLDEIHIDYDYRATVLALNQAKITKDFAFFTGIELFLQAEGHRWEPSTVHFQIPQGWKLITALKETSDPMTFTADNYDVLVDAPAEMGNFDVTKFEVEGKPHYFVANPAGAFSAEKSQKFTELLGKVATVDSKIFGGLPYEKYVYFYFFTPPESNASGALEHLNSHVSFAPPGNFATPERIIGTGAHEYFHTWNVKRLRPAEMWPYDYSLENETPLLWVSEGFTNYFGSLSTYRAGINSEKEFLGRRGSVISDIEANEARNYISPAMSSVSTWTGYDTPVAFGISYYAQGENLGALLDISIRHDSDSKYGLEDVMRSMFDDFYKKDRGFTTEDMLGVIKRLTKKDYHDFYRRYVFGTEVPNYDEIYGYAGYKLDKSTARTPIFGFGGRFRNGGFTITAVNPASPAATAGLREGDIILKMNGQDPRQVSLDELAGQSVKLAVERSGSEMELAMTVGVKESGFYTLAEMPQPSPEQLKIRQAWLKR
jgi:predicted metalloprotease with PDZ domain